mgnify:CR=1 FL=1
MKIHNVHQREYRASADDAADLLAGLGSTEDRLWPKDRWPPMVLDAPLGVGAKGGHGPIRYHVSEYMPGNHVTFQFDDEGLIGGMNGHHRFEIVDQKNGTTLRHVIDATCDLKMWLVWHVMVGPMHDATLEDALDRAERCFGGEPKKPARWSFWVRAMRRVVARSLKKKRRG